MKILTTFTRIAIVTNINTAIQICLTFSSKDNRHSNTPTETLRLWDKKLTNKELVACFEGKV